MKQSLLFAHSKQHQPQENQYLPIRIGLVDIIHCVHVIDAAPQRSCPENRLEGIHPPVQQIFPHHQRKRPDIVPPGVYRIEQNCRKNEDSRTVHHLVRTDASVIIKQKHSREPDGRSRRDQRIADCTEQPLHLHLPVFPVLSGGIFGQQHKKARDQGDPCHQRALLPEAQWICIGKAHEDVLPDLFLDLPVLIHIIIISVNRKSGFPCVLPSQNQFLLRMTDLPDIGPPGLRLKFHRNRKKSRSLIGIQRHVSGKNRLSQIIGNGQIHHLTGKVIFREDADAFQISAVRDEDLLNPVILPDGFRLPCRGLVSRGHPAGVQNPDGADEQHQHHRIAQDRIFDCTAFFQLSVHCISFFDIVKLALPQYSIIFPGLQQVPEQAVQTRKSAHSAPGWWGPEAR